MGRSNSEACQDYVDGKERAGSRNVWQSNGNLYSYGTHFMLATRCKDVAGGKRILINADKYSVTTSQHQSDIIRAAGLRGFDIPFSSLDAAGIRVSLGSSKRSKLFLSASE